MRRVILSLLALAWSNLLPPMARAETLSQLETQARTLLRDTSSDVSYQEFSNATIDAFLNEGQRQMQNDAWLYQGYFSMSLTSGVPEYALPSDFIAIVRVTISSTAITQVSEAGLDGGGGSQGYGGTNTNWTTSLSTPTEFYINEFVTGTPPNIGFYPTPKFNSTNSVFVQYIRQVPTLVNPTDVPFGGNAEYLPYHDALADFAAARGWQLLGRSDLSTFLMSLYTSRASQARANLNKMPNFLPGASGNRGPRQ